MKDDDEPVWAISVSTGGRPIHCPLPPDLSSVHRGWIADHLPSKAKLTRTNERIDLGPRAEDTDTRLDALRTVTQQVTEKKIELIELERELGRLKLELQNVTYQLDERRRYAKSFAGAMNDLIGGWESKSKK